MLTSKVSWIVTATWNQLVLHVKATFEQAIWISINRLKKSRNRYEATARGCPVFC
jgi:hypothetical protein